MDISVVLVTQNSEARLDSVLRSVANFEEIVVVDLDSKDRTREIAESHGVSFYSFKPKEGTDHVAEARRYGVLNARNRWVFLLRDYEYVPRKLSEYVHRFVEENPDVYGLFIPKKRYVLHRFIKSAYPDYGLRLIEKHHSEISPFDGSQPDVKGEVKSIPASEMDLAIVMLTIPLEVSWRKDNMHSKYEAALRINRKVTFATMLFSPFFRFLNSYLVRGAILYGREGFIVSVRESFYNFMVLTKVHESQRIKQFNKQYENTGISIPELQEE
ncbi:MAG: glycosyltransferase [Muribaculaceae bacterium]|nr:glycosyltransferase [Muribaculaceae bacterium]